MQYLALNPPSVHFNSTGTVNVISAVLALAWQLPTVPVEVEIPGIFNPKFKWALKEPLLIAYCHGSEFATYTLSDFLVCDHPLFTADLCLGRDHMLVHRTEIHPDEDFVSFSPNWVRERSYVPRIVMPSQRNERMPNNMPRNWMLHRFLPLTPLQHIFHAQLISSFQGMEYFHFLPISVAFCEWLRGWCARGC
jgi:hypothetical protein